MRFCTSLSAKHQDHQHALVVQRHEIDMPERELPARCGTVTTPTKWVIADSSSEALRQQRLGA